MCNSERTRWELNSQGLSACVSMGSLGFLEPSLGFLRSCGWGEVLFDVRDWCGARSLNPGS